MTKQNKTLTWVILFAIAMGFLESAVVIYLRELYYKNGFHFPLTPIEPKIARVEFLRELATIIMLAGIGFLAGKNSLQRFAYFCLSFAVWDIFYYLFLYVFIQWPGSFSTWDILFLIPFPWVGPVWAPCLISMVMIVGAIIIIQLIDKNFEIKIPTSTQFLMYLGVGVCMLSFMWDYIRITPFKQLWNPSSSQSLFHNLSTYVPQSFNSPLFFIGFFLICLPFCSTLYKTLQLHQLTTKTNQHGN